ncbi:type II toxin-antitoxin system mRNA interferase toxin, RelE/StbE family [Patescibacteria group bacterium]|nr:type II toxin-antitoxin system mRNA interferase toxin, RelE/StbE family [Patescibacteria group bacterium]
MRLSLFQKQPTHPTLRNHKLKGKLKAYCSINITGDIRAVYRIEELDKKESTVKFVRLGSHSELYS